MILICPTFYYNKDIADIKNIIDAFMIFFF